MEGLLQRFMLRLFPKLVILGKIGEHTGRIVTIYTEKKQSVSQKQVVDFSKKVLPNIKITSNKWSNLGISICIYSSSKFLNVSLFSSYSLSSDTKFNYLWQSQSHFIQADSPSFQIKQDK